MGVFYYAESLFHIVSSQIGNPKPAKNRRKKHLHKFSRMILIFVRAYEDILYCADDTHYRNGAPIVTSLSIIFSRNQMKLDWPDSDCRGSGLLSPDWSRKAQKHLLKQIRRRLTRQTIQISWPNRRITDELVSQVQVGKAEKRNWAWRDAAPRRWASALALSQSQSVPVQSFSFSSTSARKYATLRYLSHE